MQNIFLMLLARCNPYPWGWSRLLYTPGAPTFTLVAPDALPYLSPGWKEVCTFPVSFLYLGAQTFSLCRLQGEIFENTICTHQLRYSWQLKFRRMFFLSNCTTKAFAWSKKTFPCCKLAGPPLISLVAPTHLLALFDPGWKDTCT